MPRVELSALCMSRGHVPAALFSCFLLATSAIAQSPLHLLPAPREAHFTATTNLPEKITVAVPARDPEDEFAAHDLDDFLQAESPKQSAPASAPFRVLLFE